MCLSVCLLFFCLQVWAVLKPGFLALLNDPFDTELLDIIIFKVLPVPDGKGDSELNLADQIKERNPLRYTFQVSHCSTSSPCRL